MAKNDKLMHTVFRHEYTGSALREHLAQTSLGVSGAPQASPSGRRAGRAARAKSAV